MKGKREGKRRCWIVLLLIVVVVVIGTGSLFVLKYFSPKTIEITGITATFEFSGVADVYINTSYYQGWKEIHYMNFRFYVDVRNSNSSDVSDLKIVLELRVDNDTIESNQKTVGTLKTGETRRLFVPLYSVLDFYLFTESGSYRGVIEAVVSLYQEDLLVDREVRNPFYS